MELHETKLLMSLALDRLGASNGDLLLKLYLVGEKGTTGLQKTSNSATRRFPIVVRTWAKLLKMNCEGL